jgi:hypothetical protein
LAHFRQRAHKLDEFAEMTDASFEVRLDFIDPFFQNFRHLLSFFAGGDVPTPS